NESISRSLWLSPMAITSSRVNPRNAAHSASDDPFEHSGWITSIIAKSLLSWHVTASENSSAKDAPPSAASAFRIGSTFPESITWMGSSVRRSEEHTSELQSLAYLV